MQKPGTRSLTAIAVVLVLAVGGVVFALSGKDDDAGRKAAIGATIDGQIPAGAQAGDVIPGEYIVSLKPGVAALTSLVTSLLSSVDGVLQRTFTTVLPGFSAKLTSSAAALLRANPAVAAVEPNRVVTASDTAIVQKGATWGITRTSVREAINSTSLYTYLAGASGAGVTAYVLDTGIYLQHTEFAGGRAIWGTNTVDNVNADGNGHGTHVAGTIGGTTYGMAKKVKLVAVKVLAASGSGSIAGVIQGMDWVAKNRTGPSVANMSLGGAYSDAMNLAANNLSARGVVVVGAAGNDNRDACNYSPGSTPAMITVTASDIKDIKATYSNFGKCVDLVAPGTAITSAWIGSAAAITTISGTSMAAPHVAGQVAKYLCINPTATPAAAAAWLRSKAQVGLVKNLPAGTPNLLLFGDARAFGG